MSKQKVWFITGAGRGMGVDIAKAALAAGHKVIASGRDTERVKQAIGDDGNLLVVRLDVTSLEEANSAVQAAVERFGTIDVLVNNAASFYAGFFEELAPTQIQKQLDTNLIGPMNVTRAVLPVMRKARSGHIISISSLAGIVGQDFCVAYSASKFGLEGWMESLQLDVAPFGIHTTIVEPGFFRTELLEPESTIWAELSIDDYASRTAATRSGWEAMNGKQSGDPSKLAHALLTIAGEKQPPLRWIAGADAVAAIEQKVNELQKQIDAYRGLSTSLSYEQGNENHLNRGDIDTNDGKIRRNKTWSHLSRRREK
ncbi:SDR family NAD(P)-dependent oxidoreductase [Paenibacillus sp. RUD330]|uniref:SDR family NAD(P)-dependent oxidoreductase n=2 Tax=Paenibacillus TaxID=44249 RepID=UPI000B92D046|nr:SDR family NAD(P)-dependent oxidoreductase [Paenibacillus sp. RUD330]ASS65267.1 SDR family NAD(P)-dependent oxidoreductase [Paenibacillus sp. RUD330]